MSVRYETIMVFSMTLDEEAIAALLKRFTDLIAENGTVESVAEWGRRRLAYAINDETDGYYVLVNFESDPSFIAELERIYRITDGVLRTLVVRKEHDDPVVAVKQAVQPAAAVPDESGNTEKPAEETPAPAAEEISSETPAESAAAAEPVTEPEA